LVSTTDSPEAAQLLSDDISQRTLTSTFEAVDVVLQYLEDVQSESATATEGAADPIVLAAVRLSARFAAEALPSCETRIASILPFLLTVRGGLEGPAQGVHFMLPVIAAALTDAPSSTSSQPGEESSSPPLQTALLATPSIDALSQFIAQTASLAQSLRQASDPTRAVEVERSLADGCAVLVLALDGSTGCGRSHPTIQSVVGGRPALGAALYEVWAWGRAIQELRGLQTGAGGSDESMADTVGSVSAPDDAATDHRQLAVLPLISSACLCAVVLSHAVVSGQVNSWAAKHIEAASDHIMRTLDSHLAWFIAHGEGGGMRPDSEPLSFWRQTLVASETCCTGCPLFKAVATRSVWIRHAMDTCDSLPSGVADVTRRLLGLLAS
jgi:plasmid stabilization system protein ParE